LAFDVLGQKFDVGSVRFPESDDIWVDLDCGHSVRREALRLCPPAGHYRCDACEREREHATVANKVKAKQRKLWSAREAKVLIAIDVLTNEGIRVSPEEFFLWKRGVRDTDEW
jgi:hypothetical protein